MQKTKLYRKVAVNTSADAALIKEGIGEFAGAVITNNAATVAFVKFYDLSTVPVVGTSPVLLTVRVAANGMANIAQRERVQFENGLGIGITTTMPDNATTGVTAGSVIAQVFYR